MKNIEFINAGAGSGKTWTLTTKMAELIGSGATSPSRVILTTFTKLAAEEFRVKARAKLLEMGYHEEAAMMDSATVGTVHSVALGYIRRYWYLLGLGAGVEAMPEEDEARYIDETLFYVATDEDVAVFNRYAEEASLKLPKSSKYDYDYWKRDIRDLVAKAETFAIEDFGPSLQASLELFDDLFADEGMGGIKALRRNVVERMFRIAGEWRKEFAAYKKEHNLISYNDMERLFLELLGMSQVREDISQGVDYVFVDEFQDSNPIQVKIFDMLSDLAAKKSFWVGDPKQAIYDFRGCDTALTTAVTSFVEEKARAKEEGFSSSTLGDSRRSEPALVDLANRVFVPVFDGALAPGKVRLNPVREAALPLDQPRIIHWNTVPGMTAKGRPSLNQEIVAETIAVNVFNLVNGNGQVRQVVDKDSGELRDLRPGDVAVLCRYDEEVKSIAARLRALGAPVATDESRDAGRVEVAFLLGVLNYIAGSTNLLEAELASMYGELTTKEIVKNPEKVATLPLFKRLKALRWELSDKPVSRVVSGVIDRFDLERFSSRWGDGASRMDTLEAVKALAASYETRCLSKGEAATLSGFIGALTASGASIDGKTRKGGVNVMTYHKSKGLEWNVVVLVSLDADELESKKFSRHNFFGTVRRRLTSPSPENLYSDFVLRYIPRIWTTSTANLPDTVMQRIDARKDLREMQEETRAEMARLLYVGVTRARDVLITYSPDADKMAWLKNLGIQSAGCASINGGWGKVWGDKGPNAWVLKMDRTVVPVEPEDEDVSWFKMPDSRTDRKPKYVSPSSLTEASPATFRCVFPTEGSPRRIGVSGNIDSPSVFGTCIHNVFAAYREGDAVWNRLVAERTVAGYGFSGVIDPSDVVKGADTLYAWLRKTYGEPVAIHRETPFCLQDGWQVVTGEMDLVWETAEGCVLVDYKNYPGFDDVLDPTSEFYVGKYLPQLQSYRKALVQAGKTVRDTLAYYAVQGKIVRIQD